MAVAQQRGKPGGDGAPRDGAPDGTRRAGVLDAVLEDGRCRAVGVHGVHVHPARERAGDLLVGEAVGRVDVAVLGYPAQAQGAERHGERDPRAIREAAGPRHDAHGIPGRQQPFERTRTRVPRPQRVEREPASGCAG